MSHLSLADIWGNISRSSGSGWNADLSFCMLKGQNGGHCGYSREIYAEGWEMRNVRT